MYARCKEEECEEYATQGAEAIFANKIKKILQNIFISPCSPISYELAKQSFERI